MEQVGKYIILVCATKYLKLNSNGVKVQVTQDQ